LRDGFAVELRRIMIRDKKIVVVMPAYNARKTLCVTHQEVLEQGIVDLIILVDDASHDDTVKIANGLPHVKVFVHDKNMGYGANQKTCYRMALQEGADIIVMVHPDYQYTPKLIPAMAALIGNGLYHCVLGSRVLGGQALKGGMPLWKYLANRVLTLIENLMVGAKISEYHTGYRAFSRTLLEAIPYERNSNGFVFDNQILVQILWFGYPIGEISCPARYFAEASSIGFLKSVHYGFGCLWTALTFRLAKLNLVHSRRFSFPGERFQKTSSRVTR
jgi:glycosyltransferase involved in cell wall biosynthesis